MNLTWDSNQIDTDAVAAASAAASRETILRTVVKPSAAAEAATASVSISFESHVKFILISF